MLRTSHVGNAEEPDVALLYHAALVGEQRDSAGDGTRGGLAVGEVVLAGVWTRLVGCLL